MATKTISLRVEAALGRIDEARATQRPPEDKWRLILETTFLVDLERERDA